MSGISTHVTDLLQGKPAVGVRVRLERLNQQNWEKLADGVTDLRGQCPEVLRRDLVKAGTYRFLFASESYFALSGITTIYPEIAVTFLVREEGVDFHLPLQMSPFGFATYRGN